MRVNVYFVLFDEQMRLAWLSGAAGGDPQGLIGTTPWQFHEPCEQGAIRDIYEQVRKTGRMNAYSTWVRIDRHLLAFEVMVKRVENVCGIAFFTVAKHVPAEVVSLPARERELLYWLGEGYSLKEIAYEMGIKDSTVRTHLGIIRRKFGMDTEELSSLSAKMCNPLSIAPPEY